MIQPLVPRHYQETGVMYATTPRVKLKPDDLFPTLCRSLISDAPGAGKTLQGQLAADILSKQSSDTTSSICVICPAHLVPQWFNDICNQFPNDDVVSIEGTEANRRKYANTPARWYIISTQSLRSEKYLKLMQRVFLERHVNVTIIDESHYVKNRDALQSKHIRELTEPIFCHHVILLSATPIMKEADDLWHQLRIIDPITFRSHERFLNEYCWFTWTSWGAVNVTLKKDAARILQATPIKHPVTGKITSYIYNTGWMLGRSYDEIGLELPKLINPPPILTTLSKSRRKMYNDIKNVWWTHISDEDSSETFTANSAMEVMHLLRRIINSPEKIDTLCSYLDSDVGPFFIVCDYKQSCRDVESLINHHFNTRYRITVITGEIEATTRVELAKQRSTEPNDIIIATMGSLTEGCDLSSCSTVYFYEQATTPGRMHQVLSRVRRHRNTKTTSVSISQEPDPTTGFYPLLMPLIDDNERPVLCRYFHAENTLDQRIHAVCYQRAINIRELIKVELAS